tara:strand:- start:6 stop:203 length:198 start_codon:yes stop_codon:yes gene_type:complete
MMILQLTNFIGIMTMTDSFMHNHQAALDSQRENDAIQYLQDCGVYPDPLEDIVENDFFPMENDYE